MDSATQLFALFGNPVSHSMGPVMHNLAFAEKNVNAVYLAFAVRGIEKAVASIKSLGIQGVSVTIPFKEQVIPLLDRVDRLALEAGAVNTIVNRDNRLIGYNTDCQGAVEPLKRIGRIAGKKVCILGAGGAARAVAVGMQREKGVLFITNRSEKRGRALAEQVKGEFVSLEQLGSLAPDMVINTTSLGMTPDVDTSPVGGDFFKKGMVVMDIVYNPLETKMLKEAKRRGCTTIDGVSMFVCQGAAQFELFTGLKAPVDIMRKTVLENLV